MVHGAVWIGDQVKHCRVTEGSGEGSSGQGQRVISPVSIYDAQTDTYCRA